MAGEFRDSFRRALSELFLGGDSKETQPEVASETTGVEAGSASSPLASGDENDRWLQSLGGGTAGTNAQPSAPLDVPGVQSQTFRTEAIAATPANDAAPTPAEVFNPSTVPTTSIPVTKVPSPELSSIPQPVTPFPEESYTSTERLLQAISDPTPAVVEIDDTPVFSVDSTSQGPATDETPRYARTSIIAEGTEIDGEIRFGSAAEIYGILHGNVASRDDIFTKGTIVGNVVAANLDMVQAQLEGDVITFGTTRLSDDSVLTGDLNAAHLDLRGTLSGNSSVKNEVNIYNSAVLSGDVEAHSIAVGHGAKIKGTMLIGQE